MNFKNTVLIIISVLSSILSIESFKTFLNDDGGGLVLPISGQAFNDEEWMEYQRLNVDENVKSINPRDLPEDFCDEACRVIDDFRRKTACEEVEWVLYVDYRTGEVIYCWKGESGNCDIDWERIHLNGKKIVSIHNHIKGYYSFPSPENFDMLENDFEDYEVITSQFAFWIIEFKGFIKSEMRKDFQDELAIAFNKLDDEIKSKYIDFLTIIKMTELICSEYLLEDIDKKINGISLVLRKKEYG